MFEAGLCFSEGYAVGGVHLMKRPRGRRREPRAAELAQERGRARLELADRRLGLGQWGRGGFTNLGAALGAAG